MTLVSHNTGVFALFFARSAASLYWLTGSAIEVRSCPDNGYQQSSRCCAYCTCRKRKQSGMWSFLTLVLKSIWVCIWTILLIVPAQQPQDNHRKLCLRSGAHCIREICLVATCCAAAWNVGDFLAGEASPSVPEAAEHAGNIGRTVCLRASPISAPCDTNVRQGLCARA